MTKISINLLPAEFTRERIKDTQYYKIQSIGVVVILVLVFLSSLVVALRLIQSQRINKAQDRLNKAQEQVIRQKEKQVTLMALKNRLTVIDKYLQTRSQQAEMLTIFTSLVPQPVSINSLEINQTGEITTAVSVPDIDTLEILTTNLTDRNLNYDKISMVNLESINRNRGGVYILNLKIKP